MPLSTKRFPPGAKLVILILILLPGYLFAQNNLPAVYEIKTDTGTVNEIGFNYWQYLEDPNGKLSIDQVSSPGFSSQFHSAELKKVNAKIARTCWYRYHFKNSTDHEVTLMLPANVEEAKLYWKDTVKHQWVVKRNGKSVPWSKRDGLKKQPYFSCTLRPGQQILIYERSLTAVSLPSILRTYAIGYYQPVVQKYYIDETLNPYQIPMSVLCGILLLAGVINLIFFGIVKERFYLYFGLYALFNAFTDFLNSTDVLFREHPGSQAAILSAVSGLSVIFNVAFTRIYLNTRQLAKKTDRALVVCVAAALVSQVVIAFWVESLPILLSNAIKLATLMVVILINLLITLMLVKILLRRIAGGWVKALILGPLNVFPFIVYSFLLLNVFALLMHAAKAVWPMTSWLRDNYNNMDLFASGWLIIGMSIVLFKRFQDLQNKIISDTLDNERVLREKEEERNQLIAKQNEELELQVKERTLKLSRSLTDLKAAQTQLIQSEKMASLGELTAGIAHEIQNPLNFVNNFSDVNREMIDEVEEEIQSGNIEEALALLADIKGNEIKINHHGKRADGIVKGMLEHSRRSSGQKQPADINKLTDEYLRLAYHGLRAKDKTFNAELITHYAPDLPLPQIIAQDVGRVLLNLFNNAFYATQRQKDILGDGFKPVVMITTVLTGDGVEISVKDNGTGIPADIREKIMQPFFTTKPTGQGTGLGLSLSYDIVVKAHGGQLTVDSTEGKGAVFTLYLPLINV